MNRKTTSYLHNALILAAILLGACGGGQSEATKPGGTSVPTPPAEYAGKTNPFANQAAAAEAGKGIFTSDCSTCHGVNAKGDGPAAAALDPKPSNLAALQSILNDGYLLWRISEGGMQAPFDSAMPAWKGILSERQIWQVITYLRTSLQ
jgi:mono/diheme cytochrome c family protein